MTRYLSFLAVFALTTLAVSAQQTEVNSAWGVFQRTHGRAFDADWNPRTGTPQAIFGRGMPIGRPVATLEAARPHAIAVLERHHALLGRGDSIFVEDFATTVRHLHYFIYAQKYKGLDVLDGRADVRINRDGIIAMFGAAAVPIPKGFDLTPTLTSRAARRIAEAQVIGAPVDQVKGEKRPGNRLVIWSDPRAKRTVTPVLAWEIRIDQRPDALVVGRAYVDARTGSQLEYRSDVYNCRACDTSHVSLRAAGDAGEAHRARLRRALHRIPHAEAAPPTAKAPLPPLTGTVMAWTNVGLRPNDPLKNVPLANLRVTSSVGNAFTDAQGRFSIPYNGTTPVTVTANLVGRHCGQVTNGAGPTMTAQAPVTPGTPATIQFGSQNMGELDHAQTSAYYWVNSGNVWIRGHLPTRTTELDRLSGLIPFPNSNGACNGYYSGMTIRLLRSSATCHHAAYSTFLLHEWGHGLDDAFGGIVFTDGLSEGWADLVSIYQVKDPLIFANFWKTQTPTWVRSALNTKTFPHSGGTHAKGEVWMGWAWDLRTDLIAVHGPQQGSDLAEAIVIPTIVANAANIAAAVREVFLLDDNDGNLRNGTPNYVSLEKASLKRTVPFPKIDAGILTHTPLTGTSQQLTPRPVRVEAKALIGNFVTVELVYDVGSGPVRREMVPSGKTDEYIALLPGVLSPVDVAYHIEARHSLNKTFRLPEFADIGYSVGKEDIFFLDDFETVKAGWSSAPLFGSKNDFERGAPAGASGNSWGTNWSDPSRAWSGTTCWGNNLRGAYQQSLACRLRSPTLDLTGKTNVKLRFMRWLQVQDGRFDPARVLVNGKTVWSNPLADLLDRSWTKFDLRIPAADNNPAVQLEWQMIADGGKELAGWNIDDVTLYSFQALPKPAVQFTIDPAQVGLGKQSQVKLEGAASAPILVLVSTTPGPITLPGLPTIHVGAPFSPFMLALDAAGKLSTAITAPTTPSATGALLYCHALQLTGGNTVTASNPALILIGK